MKAREVAAAVERIAPPERGIPGDGQSGWKFGDPEREVRTVAFCWSPTSEVIERAAQLGVDMLVIHEPLLYPDLRSRWYREAPAEEKEVNRKRLDLLRRHNICVYGAHSNWDVKEGMGVADALGAVMGFEEEVGRGFVCRVYRVPPVSLGALAEEVKDKLKVDKVRVVGDLEREVTRVGTMIGGLGQLFTSPEEPWRLGAEAVIYGEALEYTLRYAVELGLGLIEAGHMATENPGIRNFPKALKEECPELRTMFLDSGTPWRFL